MNQTQGGEPASGELLTYQIGKPFKWDETRVAIVVGTRRGKVQIRRWTKEQWKKVLAENGGKGDT